MLNKEWLKKSKRNLRIENYKENMDKYALLTYLSMTIIFGTLVFSIILGFNLYGRVMLISSICLYLLVYPFILSFRKKAYNYYEEAIELTNELKDIKLKEKPYKMAFIEKQFIDLKYCINSIKSYKLILQK